MSSVSWLMCSENKALSACLCVCLAARCRCAVTAIKHAGDLLKWQTVGLMLNP